MRPSGARIIADPTGVTLSVGETLMLNCTGENNTDAPNPLVFRWMRGGLILSNTLVNEIVVNNFTITSVLVIPAVTRENAGRYSCTVQNRQEVDAVASEQAVVVVNCECQALSLPPSPSPCPPSPSPSLSLSSLCPRVPLLPPLLPAS